MWVYVGVSSAVTVASGNITLTEPAGVQSGDLLVSMISYRSNAAFTKPSDWTNVTSQNTGNTTANTTGSIGSGHMAYVVRGSSAPGLVFTRTAGDVAIGRVVAYRHQHGTPAVVNTSTTLAAAATAVSVTGLTTANANDLIVVGACGARNSTFSAFDAATDPTTASGTGANLVADPLAGIWQERADSGTTTGADCSLAIADAMRATAGATGNLTMTASSSARHVVLAAAFRVAADESMTMTPTSRGSWGGSGTAWASSTSTTKVTTSFTPSNNALLVAILGSENEAGGDLNATSGFTISDSNGLTWTERVVRENAYSGGVEEFVKIFTAPVSTGAAGTITITHPSGWTPSSSNINENQLHLFDVTGYNTSSPVGATGAINNTGDAAYALALTGFTAYNSCVIGAVYQANTATGSHTATPGANCTELYDSASATFTHLQTQYRGVKAQSKSVPWVDVNSGSAYESTHSIAVAIEIKAATAASAMPLFQRGRRFTHRRF